MRTLRGGWSGRERLLLRDQTRGELWRSERVAVDAFFFDRYLHLQSK